MKCDRKAGRSTSPANCIQSDAKRMHSNSCFRMLSHSDTVHLREAPMLNHCTALRVLSVVYTTEKKQEHTGCTDRQEVEGIAMAKKSPNPNRRLCPCSRTLRAIGVLLLIELP